MPSYEFTGDQPEVFPSLSWWLTQGGADDATVEPGTTVTINEPIVHPRLRPTDKAERLTWDVLYDPADLEAPEPEPVAPAPEPTLEG